LIAVQACRPAYTLLWKATERWGAQVVACTATATAEVQRDIEQCLHMKAPRSIRMEVVKKNLHICISSKGNSREAEISLARLVKQSSAKKVLVFCCSRRNCELTARVLVLNNVAAEAYHSQMEDRQGVERRVHAGVASIPDHDSACIGGAAVQCVRWDKKGEVGAGVTRVVCATIAFGLGMGLPWVGLIVHWDAAKSVQEYVQQIGR
jgi:ATP-dependent DNA helicase RecQ